MDNDGNPAQFKSENNYAPTPKKYVYINEGIELPLNWKKVRTEQGKRNEDEMQKLGILFIFTKVVDK